MKKRVFISVIIVLIVLAHSLAAYPFLNEPTGYNDLPWGTDLETYLKSGKKLLEKKDSLYYGYKINGVDVDVGYEFFQDRLYGITIHFPTDKRDNIISYFKNLHGEPTLKKKGRLFWIGFTTKIVINKKDVEIVSSSIEREYEKTKAGR